MTHLGNVFSKNTLIKSDKHFPIMMSAVWRTWRWTQIKRSCCDVPLYVCPLEETEGQQDISVVWSIIFGRFTCEFTLWNKGCGLHIKPVDTVVLSGTCGYCVSNFRNTSKTNRWAVFPSEGRRCKYSRQEKALQYTDSHSTVTILDKATSCLWHTVYNVTSTPKKHYR